MILNDSADWQGKLKVTVGHELIDHFWTPDLIIHDLVKFYKPEMVSDIAALKIRRENSVYYKLRADLTVVCKGMEFGMYPFDKHVCYLKLTSCEYNYKNNLWLLFLNANVAVGHNTDAMILNGGFTYEDVNQRELRFGVKVFEVGGSSHVFVGRNSK